MKQTEQDIHRMRDTSIRRARGTVDEIKAYDVAYEAARMSRDRRVIQKAYWNLQYVLGYGAPAEFIDKADREEESREEFVHNETIHINIRGTTMKKHTSAKKTGAKAPAKKTAMAPKKSVAKKAPVTKQAPLKKTATPAKELPLQEAYIETPVSVVQVMSDAFAQVASPTEAIPVQTADATTPVPLKRAVVSIAKAPLDLNAVSTHKTSVRAGDIADGDTDKGGRFEVFVGETKIGEVAFCSVIRMRDGVPNGYRRSWRGEDVKGAVMFTEGKRMKTVVELMVGAWCEGNGIGGQDR